MPKACLRSTRIRGTLKTAVILLEGDPAYKSRMLCSIASATYAKILSFGESVNKIEKDDLDAAHEFYQCGDYAMFTVSPEWYQAHLAAQRLKAEAAQRAFEQSAQWALQGLCTRCGGRISMFFS